MLTYPYQATLLRYYTNTSILIPKILITHLTNGSSLLMALQYNISPPPSNLPILHKISTKQIQAINGTILYYSRELEPYIQPDINTITTSSPYRWDIRQNKHNIRIRRNISSSTYKIPPSNMRLHINLDAAYLVLPNTRRRGSEIFYLSDNPINTKTIPTPKNNGSILTDARH